MDSCGGPFLRIGQLKELKIQHLTVKCVCLQAVCLQEKPLVLPEKLQQVGVVLQNRQDEGLHIGGKLILSVQIGLKDLAVQPHQDLTAL